MTDQQKIAAILSAIQTDETLITLVRASVTNNIPNLSSAQLEMIMQLLQLPET